MSTCSSSAELVCHLPVFFMIFFNVACPILIFCLLFQFEDTHRAPEYNNNSERGLRLSSRLLLTHLTLLIGSPVRRDDGDARHTPAAAVCVSVVAMQETKQLRFRTLRHRR